MGYRSSGQSGPPAWLVILVGAALVFGGYFIWIGVRNYMRGAFAAVTPLTPAAQTPVATGLLPTDLPRFTPVPTRTPVPPCQEFRVVVPEAIVRECASTRCAVAGTRREGEVICVLERDYMASDWFIVDLDDSQFFTTLGYMHESLLQPVNPTPTPSITSTPLPTLTPLPSNTPLPTPAPSNTPDLATPATPTPSFTPSPTPPLVSG